MESTQAVAMLAALAQESRMLVFRRLAAVGSELTAGDLARELEIPANTLSFHLKELASAELVTSRRAGRSIYYSLNQESVRNLLSYLSDDCCGGRPELCGLPSRPQNEKLALVPLNVKQKRK